MSILVNNDVRNMFMKAVERNSDKDSNEKQYNAETLNLLWTFFCIRQLNKYIPRKNISKKKLIASILFGLYFADLFTGLLHIFFDNKKCTNVKNPLHLIAFAFQDFHHKDPRYFIRGKKPLAPSGQMQIILFLGIPVMFGLTKMFHHHNYLMIFNITFCLVASWSQIIHGCSHVRYAEENGINETGIYRLPKIVKKLQDFKFLLNHRQHSRHHQYGTNDFAIVNGWSNPLLNYLYCGVLEKIIRLDTKHFNPVDASGGSEKNI